FFFQAEDGIRDFHVTGVQTCALPISPTKFTSAPIMRWKRTQMSAWMYSMMWPMWNLPLAYGRAVVTKSWRAVMAAGAMGAAKPKIGRASCRERVESSGVDGALRQEGQ